MEATLTYYVNEATAFTQIQQTYAESPNGHIPGVKWIDQNEHEYRAIVTRIDFANFCNKNCNYTYTVQIRPKNTPTFLHVDTKTVQIGNQNYIKLADGGLVDDPSDLIETVQSNEGTSICLKTEYQTQYMPQFDYFVMLIGKNIPHVAFGLYDLFTSNILKREGLTLTAE